MTREEKIKNSHYVADTDKIATDEDRERMYSIFKIARHRVIVEGVWSLGFYRRPSVERINLELTDDEMCALCDIPALNDKGLRFFDLVKHYIHDFMVTEYCLD